MKEIADLCQSIASVINDSGKWSAKFVAKQEWTVSLRAEEIGPLTVTLVPETESKNRVTRSTSHTGNTAVLSVIMQERVADSDRVTELACMIDEIDLLLRNQGDFDTSLTRWRYQSCEKVFIRPHLEQFNVFTCGMAITFVSASP